MPDKKELRELIRRKIDARIAAAISSGASSGNKRRTIKAAGSMGNTKPQRNRLLWFHLSRQ
jgi:hypothetical protein